MPREIYRAAKNVDTPHDPERYPGLLVVRPGPLWRYCVIVPEDGQTIVALGGERVPTYRTRGGHTAESFLLKPGDRATRVRSDLPAHLSEWHVERAARIEPGEPEVTGSPGGGRPSRPRPRRPAA